MTKRRIYDLERHAQFVTFSCYRRRALLETSQARRIVLGALNAQLRRLSGRCAGFVVMPDHVHAILWFFEQGQLSECMKQWKRTNSHRIGRLFNRRLVEHGSKIVRTAVWQAKYYTFNIYTRHKMEEKLAYMHLNPVRAGLVASACEWRWSSARFYELGKSVGVPVGWIE